MEMPDVENGSMEDDTAKGSQRSNQKSGDGTSTTAAKTIVPQSVLYDVAMRRQEANALPNNLLQQASVDQHGAQSSDQQSAPVVISTADRPLARVPIKRAALQHVCFLCLAEVQQGDEIWPVQKPEGPGVNMGGKKVAAHGWCHISCAKEFGGGELVPLDCPHWVRKGTCAYQELCFYAHLPERQGGAEGARRKGASGRRNRLRKSSKVGCFRRWLIDEFGLEGLKSGSGILDVAGGKGELAFELENLNRVPTTVIDPRPLDLTSYRRKLKYGIYWRNPLMHAYIDAGVGAETPPRNPKHLRVFLDAPLMAAMPGRMQPVPEAEEAGEAGEGGGEEGEGEGTRRVQWGEVFRESARRGKEVKWTKKGLLRREAATEAVLYPARKRRGSEEGEEGEEEGRSGGGESERGGERGRGEASGREEGEDGREDADGGEGEGGGAEGEGLGEEENHGEEVEDAGEAWRVLRDASVIVGLHPDQAVGAMVELALKLRKPFAAVPCCVYSKEFPRRRLLDGQQVRRYEHLVAWLQAQHPEIRVAELDFEGKNKVLWWRPPPDDADPLEGGSSAAAR